MLTKKRQRQYLTEKEQHWLQELVVFDESRDEKALHRLRLEIKKIRALVELAKVQSGKRAAVHFSGLKKMFRQAGVIRDAGSQVRYLEERHLLSPEFREQADAFHRIGGRSLCGTYPTIPAERQEGVEANTNGAAVYKWGADPAMVCAGDHPNGNLADGAGYDYTRRGKRSRPCCMCKRFCRWRLWSGSG